MAEGQVAGRLEVPVVADLSKFASELRTKVEEAANGVVAKISAAFDAVQARADLTEAIDTAAENVKARVDVAFNVAQVRAALEEAVKEASTGTKAKVAAEVDKGQVRTALRDAVNGAIDSSEPAEVRARLDRNKVRSELQRALEQAEEDGATTVNVRFDSDGPLQELAISELRSALEHMQAEANRHPVTPRIRQPKVGFLGTLLKFGGLASLVQPAVGTIGAALTGLTAEISALAPAVGVLGAIPGLIGGAGLAFLSLKTAFSGVGAAAQAYAQQQQALSSGTKLTKSEQAKLQQAINGVDGSVIKAIAGVRGLGSAWKSIKLDAQRAVFKQLADEIKPTGERVLPILGNAIHDVSSAFGNGSKRAAQFFRTPLFRADFTRVIGSSSSALQRMGQALGPLGHAVLDFLAASAPFTQRVAGWIAQSGKWLQTSIAVGRETGTLARFLDRAGDKASQFSLATRDLWRGLKAMGRAATDSGDSILNGLTHSLQEFSVWSNSVAGQQRMKEFFDGARPAFAEVVGILGDIGRGLGRMSEDNGLVRMLRDLRYDLLPSVGHFLDQLGRSVGPSVIHAFAALADVLAELESAGGGLGAIIHAIDVLASSTALLLRSVPGLGLFVGGLLSLLTVLKAVRLVGNVFDRLIGIGTTAQRAEQGVSRLSATVDRFTRQSGTIAGVQRAYARGFASAAEGANRFTRTVSGVGSVVQAAGRRMGGLRGAVSGLTGALGGPWGIAITGAVIGLGLLMDRQRKNAEAARAHRAEIEDLAQALRDSNGEIDENVRGLVAKAFQEKEVGDTGKTVAEVAEAQGISLRQLTDSALGLAPSLGTVADQMRDTAQGMTRMQVTAEGVLPIMTQEGHTALEAADAIDGMSGNLNKAQKSNADWASAAKQVGADGTTIYSRLTKAVQVLADTTLDADSRTDALRATIDLLSGKQRSYADAQLEVNRAITEVTKATKANTKANKENEKAGRKTKPPKGLLDKSGNLSSVTETGQTAYDLLQRLEQQADSAAIAAADRAKSQGGDPAAQAKAAGQEMVRAREAAIDYAESLGLTATQAGKIADQFGLIPDTVKTAFEFRAESEASQQMLAVQKQLDNIKGNKVTTVSVLAPQARAALEAIGYSVKTLPNGQIEVRAPIGKPRADLANIMALVDEADAKGVNINVKAEIDKAATDLARVRTAVDGMPKGSSVVVKAPTALAEKELKDLGYKVTHLEKGKVEITVPKAQTIRELDAIQDRVYSLRGQAIDIPVRYRSSGLPQGVLKAQANGGVMDFYADGGVRESHVAQIAPAGAMRVWAERETGGEAYVPLAANKRSRSKAVVENVVDRFGGAVEWFSDGGFSGADALFRSSRKAGQAGVAGRGPLALVGGDLTITTQAENVSDGIGDALFELRRLRMGGI
ncbi:hypothetical protein [Actinacidiphila sp. bgisy160]|uniref:hypothetical protein n=1 Tax=Actinacidiphila sp. bgisy160 TaxID=3413796 RepID=UPI003D728759